jgi:abortive infection bacteriophage resistance protein
MSALSEQSKEFSVFLYKYMDKMNLGSVGKTAKEFGVSRQQFYKWLNGGVPALSQLRNICTVIERTTHVERGLVVAELTQILHNNLNRTE